MPSGAAKEMDSPAPPMCWDLIQGIGCIRPFAFAARPSGPARLSGPARPTGFPSTAKRSHLYIYAFPDWEYVSAHASKASAYSVVSPLRGFAPCNVAQRRHHLRRMSMHRTRDRARRRGASRANNLLDPAAPILKKFEKRSIVRHPSNSRGYTPLQKAHGTGGEMVGDGFKALSGPTLRQGGRREGGRNG